MRLSTLKDWQTEAAPGSCYLATFSFLLAPIVYDLFALASHGSFSSTSGLMRDSDRYASSIVYTSCRRFSGIMNYIP